jgi:lipoate-protein ligase A
MPATLRVIDSGVIEGRMNIALGQAMIESHQDGLVPDTLRFLRFAPTVLIGRHQALHQEIDVDYCEANSIAMVRRITGGGAIYLDEGQLGWELVIDRSRLKKATLTDLAREICEAAADGLCRLGVNAAYRPRNDIEVDGRKIGGTGGFFDGDTLFYQGTVLVDMNPEVMVSALRVPKAKLAKRSLDSAEQRIVTLKELMGESCPDLGEIQQALREGFSARFGLDDQSGNFEKSERTLANELFEDEIGRDEFVTEIDEPEAAAGVLQGEHTGPGGTIRTYLRVEGPAQNRINSALITGDFFVTPPRIIYDLEGALKGVFLDKVDSTLNCFFKNAEIEVLSVGKEDFLQSVQAAIADRALGMDHDD